MLQQREDSSRLVPGIFRDALCCSQRVGGRRVGGRRGRRVELAARAGDRFNDAAGEYVGECSEVRHRRRLTAVQRVLNGVAPAARLQVHEAGHVAGGDPEAKRVSLERAPLEKLGVRPDRRHRRELVDGDSGRGLVAYDRNERDRGILTRSLVRRGSSPLRGQIQNRVLSRRTPRGDGETAVPAGARLAQLLRLARRRGPQRHGRAVDGRTAAQNLAV